MVVVVFKEIMDVAVIRVTAAGEVFAADEVVVVVWEAVVVEVAVVALTVVTVINNKHPQCPDQRVDSNFQVIFYQISLLFFYISVS